MHYNQTGCVDYCEVVEGDLVTRTYIAGSPDGIRKEEKRDHWKYSYRLMLFFVTEDMYGTKKCGKVEVLGNHTKNQEQVDEDFDLARRNLDNLLEKHGLHADLTSVFAKLTHNSDDFTISLYDKVIEAESIYLAVESVTRHAV